MYTDAHISQDRGYKSNFISGNIFPSYFSDVMKEHESVKSVV